MTNVSVIIPVYNEEKYIQYCLKTLVDQTLYPFEIIVVDDGSTDDSKDKILETKLRLKIQNLRYLKQKHAGPGKARNYGVRKSTGQLLVFVDADMKFDKNYLRNLVKPIIRGKAVATFTKGEYVANPKNIWSKCWSINNYLPLQNRIPKCTENKSKGFRAIKRGEFIKAGGFRDIGYGEDSTVLSQLPNIYAQAVKSAICYHFNPESLAEVFVSARWFGRGDTLKRNTNNFLVFSFPNSIKRGILEAVKYKIPHFLFFKIIFDIGVTLGMIDRKLFGLYRK